MLPIRYLRLRSLGVVLTANRMTSNNDGNKMAAGNGRFNQIHYSSVIRVEKKGIGIPAKLIPIHAHSHRDRSIGGGSWKL